MGILKLFPPPDKVSVLCAGFEEGDFVPERLRVIMRIFPVIDNALTRSVQQQLNAMLTGSVGHVGCVDFVDIAALK